MNTAANGRRAPWLWRNATLPNVDYLVRMSAADFKAAQRSTEEYRRRGLLDEAQ